MRLEINNRTSEASKKIPTLQPIHRSCCNSKTGKITKQKACFDCIHCYTYQLLERIHPSKSSQKRRLDIFEIIEKIFKKHGIKV